MTTTGKTTTEFVLLERQGPVGILTLNAPEKLNAANVPMRQQLFDGLVELNRDPACRAIVLTGAGGNFCSGGDVKDMAPLGFAAGKMRVELNTRIFRLLATCPKPVVAAVEGKAFGCGLSFVATCDFAVAAKNASFSCAFIKVGLIPDFGGVWALTRRIGSRKAMELAAFSDPFSAEAALDMQLVNRLCEPGAARDKAIEMAERLARNPPVAMALLKSAINTGSDTLGQAIETEADFLTILMGTPEFAEAVTAFKEKRPPRFHPD